MSQKPPSRRHFSSFARAVASWSGRSSTFVAALIVIFLWAVSGPIFHFSDTWQLIINTGTTIVTFLMVFLIQNTQNCDTHALQLKMDELIRATKGAHTVLLDLEELNEEELTKIKRHYEDIAKEARKRLKAGKKDTDIPDIKLNL